MKRKCSNELYLAELLGRSQIISIKYLASNYYLYYPPSTNHFYTYEVEKLINPFRYHKTEIYFSFE